MRLCFYRQIIASSDAELKGFLVDRNDTNWSNLASRAMRVLLVRKDVSYARLAERLAPPGEQESARRSVEGKIQRGTFRFSFFLESLVAVGGDYPAHWRVPLAIRGSWEERAAKLMFLELDARPWLDWRELSRRLVGIGEHVTPDILASQIRSGTFPATLFLQCAIVCSFEGLELFLDQSDLVEAARKGMVVRSASSDSNPLET